MDNTNRTAAGGNWPVMLTPFKSDQSIDWENLDRLIEWYLAAGSSGFFAVCQSSEMFDLNNEERIALSEYVLKRVDGRVPVIATGTFPENTDNQSDFVKKIYDTGVEAVIILTNLFAKENEPESVWVNNVEKLLEKTADIPLGMYECPFPYKRLVPAETMAWAATTGRFFWSKDTSEDLNQIREKLKKTKGTILSLYNAHTGSLLESLRAGVFGFSGIDSNFYPELYSWMCANWKEEPEISEELQQFLVWGRMTIDIKYPLSAKEYLVLNGILESSTTRLPKEPFNSEEMEALKLLYAKTQAWNKRLGILTEKSSNIHSL
jgi:4-hydroxy-tetrahydrodipicolinate synthase